MTKAADVPTPKQAAPNTDVPNPRTSDAADGFGFEVSHTDGRARRGTLKTPHGEIQTPIFMPVGTVGSVKALGPDDLQDAGTQILLGNTYHLMLRPGKDNMRALGGLHDFMGWNGPILTDSGGFQVFSLAAGEPHKKSAAKNRPKSLVKIDEEGVNFRSHIDGSKFRMTPEESMDIQMAIGADIIMAFDQCPPGQSDRATVQKAMDRTTRWLDRCNVAMDRKASRLFGIIQGGIYDDLREAHAAEITARDLFGYSIGGLSVGESKEDMWRVLDTTTAVMPEDKPRYLMGVGTPDDLIEGVLRGVDMFDCVMPTRNARNGTLFTAFGKVSIRRAEYKLDKRPLDPTCSCAACTKFSRAYLRHLYVTGELLYHRLASLHNVTYYLRLMEEMRAAIMAGRLEAFAAERLAQHKAGPSEAYA